MSRRQLSLQTEHEEATCRVLRCDTWGNGAILDYRDGAVFGYRELAFKERVVLFSVIAWRYFRLSKTPLTVIADTVYVLSSAKFYNLPRTEIVALLTPLLRLPGFRLRTRGVILQALEFYATHNFDFTDAVIYAAMLHARSNEVYSFDQDFDDLPGINRQEP